MHRLNRIVETRRKGNTMTRNTTPQGTARNPDGTFAEGNSGGPGRPARATERQYMAVVMAACDLDTWQAIVQRAVKDAKDGDSTARAWLASYLLGKPSPRLTAPRPTRVLAMEQAEVDEVAEEVAKVQRAQVLDGLIGGIVKAKRR
jgi:hypothetical protein